MGIDELVMAEDDDERVVRFEADIDPRKRVNRRARQAIDPTYDRPVEELEAPDPPRYLGGACRYRPMPGVEIAIARATMRPDWTLVAICATCQDVLDKSVWRDPESGELLRKRASHVVGAASDHDRINLNHNVLVYALPDRVVIWMSAWHPLKTSEGVRTR